MLAGHAIPAQAPAALRRSLLIALIAFLTVVDLFGTQALLPMLAQQYQVSAAAMGTAVNACTLGMAIAAVATALFGRQLDRRRGIVLALALLALPTAALGLAPNLGIFALLRMAQGVCMATAFSLTLAHLGERCTASESAGAFAAYVTGNVASNLLGRLAAAWLADHLGLGGNFLAFAALNLAGAALAALSLHAGTAPGRTSAEWRGRWRNPRLRAAFGIGACILFAFVGTFTYINFVLAAPPFALGTMQLGLVYLVFLPSVISTPLASKVVARFGHANAMLIGFGTALLGLAALLLPNLPAVLLGLALFAIGCFLAQAAATGHVAANAGSDGVAASGLYLGCYFGGGMLGSLLLGLSFEAFGWVGCVAGVAAALLCGGYLARRCR